MPIITLPDGSLKTYNSTVTPLKIAEDISNSLKKLDLDVITASSRDIDTSDIDSVNKFAETNNSADILVLNTGGPPIIEFEKINNFSRIK